MALFDKIITYHAHRHLQLFCQFVFSCLPIKLKDSHTGMRQRAQWSDNRATRCRGQRVSLFNCAMVLIYGTQRHHCQQWHIFRGADDTELVVPTCVRFGLRLIGAALAILIEVKTNSSIRYIAINHITGVCLLDRRGRH
ncbi:hypothetical protein B0T41_22070 [Chromobacterium violaceum]|nr:hypothetical protein B0T41_22070 [Chromobacterium violaceum]